MRACSSHMFRANARAHLALPPPTFQLHRHRQFGRVLTACSRVSSRVNPIEVVLYCKLERESPYCKGTRNSVGRSGGRGSNRAFRRPGSCGMNIPTDHRVLNEQERLVAASRLFEASLDRLSQFVPAQSTVSQTAMKRARLTAAALLKLARDTADAAKMSTAWLQREKACKYAPNTSRSVLADITNSRVDGKQGGYGKKMRQEPHADTARVLRSGNADAQMYKMITAPL